MDEGAGMAKILLAGTIASLLVCSAALLKADESEKPLTNEDVAEMVKAGVPEGTIILAIQLAGQRESTRFDTRPGALIELKRAGATEKILDAVLWSQPFGLASEPKSTEISAAPGLPGEPGVYYHSSSGWVALPSFLLWPPLMAPWNVSIAFGRKDYTIALPGFRARLQIAERRPMFYLREPPSDAAGRLLEIATRKDHRELRLTSGNILPTEIDYLPDLQEVEFGSVAPNVFTFRAKSDLGTGEYLYCSAVPGAQQLLLCYEFGINLETQSDQFKPEKAQ
jgi:hypothetical protein